MGNTNTGDCTPGTCPLDNGYLLYQPSLGGSAFMLAAFAVLIPINVFTGIRHKTPLFASTIVTGLLLQVMAYIGQLLLRTDQARRSYFLVSLLGAMTGPTLISASIYLVLPHILIVYGREVSILSRPIYLSVVFLAFDVFTLAFQAVGCAFAVCGGTQDEMNQGIRVLLAGLALQAASLIAFFAIYWGSAMWRSSRRNLHDEGRAHIYLSSCFRIFLLCMQLSAAFILIRTVSSLAQYSAGLGGPLAQSQVITLVLDGALVLIACIILTSTPPGAAFRSTWADTSPYSPTPAAEAGELPLRQRNLSAATRGQAGAVRSIVDRPSQSAASTPSPRKPAEGSPGYPPGTRTRPPYEELRVKRVPFLSPGSAPTGSGSGQILPARTSPRRTGPAVEMVEPDSLW